MHRSIWDSTGEKNLVTISNNLLEKRITPKTKTLGLSLSWERGIVIGMCESFEYSVTITSLSRGARNPRPFYKKRRNLLVLGADEVVDDVGARRASAGVAEPLAAAAGGDV